ncbi:MAG: beta-lactamase family protein [Saprospiraceae bacterium]|nr:beta-lactamase family protein [Saprospiraceae bacterium]
MLVFLFQTNGILAQPTSFATQAKELLDKAVQEQQCIGIAAGFAINGEMTWQQGAGFRDQEGELDFTPATATRIASITKPMTAIAIMQLYEQGKLKLDEPIQTYLPDYPRKKEGEITIRQLLQHSSGIDGYKNTREQENQKHYPTLEDAVNIFKNRDLVAPPGQSFHYTTYGYDVLGLIIERVTGMTYETYLQINIWDKALMSNTGIEHENVVFPDKSKLYHKNDKGKLSSADPTDVSDRIPGGGVYSTISDLLRFGSAIQNFTLIKESTFALMVDDPHLKTQGNGYGLGWYLYGENPKYGNVYGHNGTQTGASTFLVLLPEVQTTIVVLSNTSGAMQAVSDIAIKLFDLAHEARM